MNEMTSAKIRQSFLDYFSKLGHEVVPSSPLVPDNDPTLLFTNAGMNQFKSTFLGNERRDYRRATTAQKCMRVSGKHNDLNNVGPSLRHHTFFEMLGNFSFGDYFKEDAISFAWNLLTKTWELPPNRLFATVFKGESNIPRDQEAYAIWKDLVPDDHIAEMDMAENFWSMGDTGPCGRCSEIHYHRGDHFPCGAASCQGINCSCDRYVEIWNNVFMEFQRLPDGTLKPLPAPSIDTGMGLERIVAILQNKWSNYDTDLFSPLLTAISERAHTSYGPLSGKDSTEATDTSLRVIADHLRAMTFLIADGVIPSNEWRGYVLRKIMRRAMRHGKRLGITEPFLFELVNVVVEEMECAYPELSTNRDTVTRLVRKEEEQFDKVLADGLPLLENTLAEAATHSMRISGDDAFKLYDTYGLPLDFIEDIAEERSLSVDNAGFEQAMERQRQRSRDTRSFSASAETMFTYQSSDSQQMLEVFSEHFDGYDTTISSDASVLAIFDDDRQETELLSEGLTGYIILDRTPFYVESGGQVSDIGRVTVNLGLGEATVQAMTRLIPTGPRVHQLLVTKGRLATNDVVSAEIDETFRNATRRNHTATHLLHAALRSSIGTHVKQAGSLVSPDRLRFDFTHTEPLTQKQIEGIEQIVNNNICKNKTVETQTKLTKKAIADGAMALFGEKYGDRVRVVSIPELSTELCGGTHCRATGEIGPFVIIQESGVASGIRRIEAFTGTRAVELMQKRRNILDGVHQLLGTASDDIIPAVQKLQGVAKRLARDVEELKVKAAMGDSPMSTQGNIVDLNGTQLVTRHVKDLEKGALRALADSLRDTLTSGLVIVASENKGKVSLIVTLTRDLAKRVHAGDIAQELAPIVGGRGGGRIDFAQAGGTLPENIPSLLSKSQEIIKKLLGDTP